MNKLGRFWSIFYTLKSCQYFHSFEISNDNERYLTKRHQKFSIKTPENPQFAGDMPIYNIICCYFSMEVSYSLTNSFPMHPFSKTSGGRERKRWEQMG